MNETDDDEYYDVVIVGSGHAGAHAAITLRQRGFDGSIAILTEEADPPYERPPLSKEYLSGDRSLDRLLIRPPEFWCQRDIRLLVSRRVRAVDSGNQLVTDDAGASVGFGKLIWAAGGRARRLRCPGGDARGSHRIRSRTDVDQLLTALRSQDSIVIIGGGHIGLEAAATLVKLNKQVTVLELQNRVLARVAGECLSRFYETEHRAHGVDLRLGVEVDRILVEHGHVCGVRLCDGTEVASGIVLAAIGIAPAVEPLRSAGAQGDDGVDIDEYCRTSLPHVYAIGDCAAHRNAFADGARIRLESVQNATDQAACAAVHILGEERPYVSIPWFWSNQYDLRLQTVGVSIGHDDALIRGDPAARSFSVLYRRQGRVIALDCVNAPRDFMQGKALVAGRAVHSSAQLADSGISLRDLVVGS